MGHDQGVFQLIERILKMKNVFVCIIMSISIMSCGNRNNKENPACGMTKAEAEAIAKKIKDDYEATTKAFEDYKTSNEETRKVEDFQKIEAKLFPLRAISDSADPLVAVFDLKNTYEIIVKLFEAVTAITWGSAIERRREPSLEVAQRTGAAKEYKIILLLDCHIENLKQQAAKLDKTKYAKTLELYSLLMQAKGLHDDPNGSYVSMIQGLDELSSNFDKTKSLAELEWK